MYGVKQPITAIHIKSGDKFPFRTMLEASNVIAGQVSHISECVNGIRHTHKGYKFVKEGDINE